MTISTELPLELAEPRHAREAPPTGMGRALRQARQGNAAHRYAPLICSAYSRLLDHELPLNIRVVSPPERRRSGLDSHER